MKPGRAQVNGIEMFYEIDGPGAIGLSMGGNILLHLATKQPDRIEAMVVVSATMYFPEQARAIMRQVAVENQPPGEMGSHAETPQPWRRTDRGFAGMAARNEG